MGCEGKIKRVIFCLACLFIISSCVARPVDVRLVTARESSDTDEPKQESTEYILRDGPQSSYTNLDARTLRDQPPSSYSLKIESFSELKSKPPSYESAAFDAAGFKWRLIFYPNGNENDGGKDYISLYLRIEKTDSLPKNWKVYVDLKLFVYNRHEDKYLTIEDGNIKRFSVAKEEWGFGQLLPLSTFTNSSNGYLVNDACSFGAEIFVIKPPEKTETLSFKKKPEAGKFTWKIDQFSKLDESARYSPDFLVGERYWRLLVYPKGYRDESGKWLTVFLVAWDYPPNAVGVKTYGAAKLRLLNQKNSNYIEREIADWFDIYPYEARAPDNFISLQDLHDESKGYLVNDKIIFELEFEVASVTKVSSN